MNRFEVLSSIGEGAYGIVLKCRDKKTNKIYAIKKFKDKDTENLSIKKVLLRELRALRQLKHPNIIKLHGSFKQNDRLYLVFDYIKMSLLDLQESVGNGMSLAVIKKIAKGVLEGLAEMHANSLLHRDIKPENILVEPDHTPKVIDFGFCRGLGSRTEPLTNYVATRWYRSPELLLSPVYGPEVDIWALGCVIGEMIDGQPLFPGDSFLDQLYCIYQLLGPLPSTIKYLAEMNEELEGVSLDMYFEPSDDFDPDFVRNRYFYKVMDENLMDLLNKMLDLDPETRITAQDALKHPFFSKPAPLSHRAHREIEVTNKMDAELSQNLSASTLTLKNIELNVQATLERKTPKYSQFRSQNKKENIPKEHLLPAIKTLGPHKNIIKGATFNLASQTVKSLHTKTLLNRFK